MLFVALIVLVVMALTGLAMIRQSSSGLSIAGNLGIRQGAVSGADLGTEAAMSWLKIQLAAPAGALDSDIAAQAYYSDWGSAADTSRLTGDPTLYSTADWNNSILVTSDDGTGNEVRYIVERLCLNRNQAQTDPNQKCVETTLTDGSDKSGTCDNYPKSCPQPPSVVHYRVSTRVKGPRNTVSFIQVMLVPT